jgi:peptide/nickel transport system substrate-binding protein
VVSCEPALMSTDRRPRRSRLQLTVAAATLSGLVCCSSASPPQPDRPVELRVGVSLPDLGPGGGLPLLVSNLTGEQLVTVGHDGRVEQRLVERWTKSADGLTWRFGLRPNLRFHDESPMEASAIQAILQPAVSSAAPAPGFKDVESISAPEAHTLEITLRRPSAFLLEDLSGFSITRQVNGASVGAGPFVEESVDGDAFVLRSFPDYFAGVPSVDRIEFSSYPSVRAAWVAMMRGDIDVLFEVGRDAIEFVNAESSVQVFSFTRSYAQTLGFNMAHPILRDRLVRRAINLAIDRESIVRTILRGHGRVADSYVWPLHWANDPTAPANRFDPAEARRLLDQAGYPVPETQARPFRFAIKCLVPNVALYETLAIAVQKNLYDVGVDLDLETSPMLDMVKRFAKGDFETFLFEMTNARGLSWMYRFLHSPVPGGATFLAWHYDAADAVLDRIRFSNDDDEVRAGVSALQRILYDDPPAAFISWDERSRAVSRRFEVPSVAGADVFTANLLWRWKPAPGSAGR